MKNLDKTIARWKEVMDGADAVVIGAGAGLSTSAGFAYSGERFRKYFQDFAEKYDIRDMYSGGFYPFDSLEESFAWWSRHIYVNRYMKAPKPVYEKLLKVVQGKDYFVITTNVDHQFQKAGFDKKRLFYTQGDYGLWQCSRPCHKGTYDNEEAVKAMVEAQGFTIGADGTLLPPLKPKMRIPSELIPLCPVCGEPMSMNLRSDNTFVETKGWDEAAERYHDFLRRHRGLHTVFLDLGCGMNTPVIFKYPFWQMTAEQDKAVYVCINKGQAYAPAELGTRAICIDGDIGEVLDRFGE